VPIRTVLCLANCAAVGKSYRAVELLGIAWTARLLLTIAFGLGAIRHVADLRLGIVAMTFGTRGPCGFVRVLEFIV
jgi:hypothetical protein